MTRVKGDLLESPPIKKYDANGFFVCVILCINVRLVLQPGVNWSY